jgi:isoleucyl-tRNA synthetase
MRVFDEHGADAMRWYLMSSPILRGGDFSVTEQGIREAVRQVLLPLWNSWYFLSLYANADGVSGRERTDSTNVLDRYVLAKLRGTIETVTAQMDQLDLFGASADIRSFVDVLTNWYIRRSRDRFWEGDVDAIDTLHTVMVRLVRLVAPLLPLVSDEIHRGLVGGSVHLADWPTNDGLPDDAALVDAMDTVRDACSAALSVRKAHGKRVRLPLATLTVASPTAESLAPFVSIVRDEVNVRDVVLTSDVDAVARRELQVVPAVIGPRLGAKTQAVIAAVKKGDWTRDGDTVLVAGESLGPGEYEMRLVARPGEASAPLASALGVVALDVEVTDELEAEGTARDVVRVVQQARRDAGLAVSDRIDLVLSADDQTRIRVEEHLALVSGETLAVSVTWDSSVDASTEIEGGRIGVRVARHV